MAMLFCFVFYAKAAKTKVVAGDLEDVKVMRQVAEEIMMTQSAKRKIMVLFAATHKAKRSTRTFAACTCLRLRRSPRPLLSEVFVIRYETCSYKQ